MYSNLAKRSHGKTSSKWFSMTNFRTERRAGVWLESLFVLAAMAFVFELFPSYWMAALWALDVRNWPRSTWFAANGIVVLTLAVIRYSPDFIQEWRERHGRHAIDRAKKQKQRELKEQREMLERIK